MKTREQYRSEALALRAIRSRLDAIRDEIGNEISYTRIAALRDERAIADTVRELANYQPHKIGAWTPEREESR